MLCTKSEHAERNYRQRHIFFYLFKDCVTSVGWQTFRGHNRCHFVDKKGDISWTLLETSRGRKCPRNVLFLGDFSWTFSG